MWADSTRLQDKYLVVEDTGSAVRRDCVTLDKRLGLSEPIEKLG